MINIEDISKAYINKIFVCKNYLIIYSLKKSIIMRNFNNEENSNNLITHTISLKFHI